MIFQIVDGGGGGGGGEGEREGEGGLDPIYKPEPDRKCVLYFKGEIFKARWHGTST